MPSFIFVWQMINLWYRFGKGAIWLFYSGYMRRFTAILAVVMALSGIGAGAQNIDSMLVRMEKNVNWIVGDEHNGRKAGSADEKRVAEYLYSQLEKMGVGMLTPEEGDDFFMVQGADTIHSRNVVGMIEGYDPKLKEEYIVIGAHYDHIGTGMTVLDGEGKVQVYPGADDNASGVATLLEVAREISLQHFMFRRSVIIAFFGGNELGTAGSWYFLNRSFPQVEKIVAMINLDMVGRSGRDNRMEVFVAGANRELVGMTRQLSGRALSLAPVYTPVDYVASDHRNFYEKGIPSVLFTTGMHRDYHTVRDTPDKLDYPQMGQLVEYVYAMAQTIADRDERIGKGGADESAGSGKGKVYVPATVDKMATFLNGGVEKFLERWVYEYIKYPDSAIRNGIRGTVVAEFVVDAKGKVKDVRIVGSLDDDIDAQVVKVIGASPKWKPATVAGKPVSVKISVPVEFKLAKSGSFKIKK